MNEVFLIGKIISNIEFKFIINSKNKAIACFEIKTVDKQIVRIQAYNQLADFVYSKLNKRKTKLTLIYWDKSKVLFEHEQSLR